MICNILFCAYFMLTLNINPARHMSATTTANVIRLSNICIIIKNDFEYNVIGVADYFRLDVTRNDVRGQIYIGYNPNIRDENIKWRSREILATLASPIVVPLEGVQAGQFLGVPNDERGQYFHIWFKGDDSKAISEIKDVVRFC